MERQKMKWHVDNYLAEVESAIYEPIIEKDVERLPLDRVKAFFLLLPRLNGEEWTDSMNNAALAIGAIHAALDAHDRIELVNAATKEQQLTVLSGDHYSGVHYRLLASQADYMLIRSLSATIGSINEMKTNFHGETLNDAHETIDLIRMVETGCIVDFLHTFNFTNYLSLVITALPLAKLIQGNLVYRKFRSTEADAAIDLLRKELLIELNRTDYLDPTLQEEILSVVSPLLDKTI